MCDHYLGPLPCDNPEPHKGGDAGQGCTHTGSWAPDRHDQSEASES
jgi:hypothetical protein